MAVLLLLAVLFSFVVVRFLDPSTTLGVSERRCQPVGTEVVLTAYPSSFAHLLPLTGLGVHALSSHPSAQTDLPVENHHGTAHS